MNVAELIGDVVASYLRAEASEHGSAGDGTARYVIDCLSPDQTAAIARSILADPELKQRVEIKLPTVFLVGQDLPSEILTDKPATYFRTAPCDKPILLIANTGDDEEQSLREVTKIGAPELQDHPNLWVRVAAAGLPLTAENLRWWEKALAGVFELRMFSLDRLASFAIATRNGFVSEGHPILHALGAALPALRCPRDSRYFAGLKERVRGHASAWKAFFSSAFKKRACYLSKQTPSQLVLTEEELRASFERVRDSIPEARHALVQAFIAAPNGWNEAAARLADCEWEEISPLFDGLKREKFNLGKETLDFFDEREPELLSADDREYLKRLLDRRTTEAKDEDIAFYESHRQELKDDSKLKSAWDLFVFGRPRECEDFLVGFAACLETLFSRDDVGSNRKMRIRCDRATKKDLRELNIDAGLYFARRYGGLKALFGERVSWNVGKLFEFDQLAEEWKRTGRANRSTARTSLQLKFVVELELQLLTGGSQVHSSQIVWKFNPNTVASEFYDDWSRLAEHPLVFCRANRVLVNPKGRFQTVDLSDVRTFVPVYDRDRGSFVPAYRKANDLGLKFIESLEAAKSQGLVAARVADEVGSRFAAFRRAYADAVQSYAEGGTGNLSVFRKQLDAYSALLEVILREAKGDRNRELLLRPLLQIGTVLVEGGPTAAIVAPWHPLRMFAMAQKAQILAALVSHLLTAPEVLFGDTRLYFKDLAYDLSHVFYPEVVLGWNGNKAELLVVTDVVNDYSLHEAPIANEAEVDDTNENPTEGSNCVLQLLQRYLALHPHEQANLSVVLFNCDSARLPQAVVDKIGSLYEEEEDVRCQVLLRHVDMGRLRDLYREIIGLSDRDGDAFNASEATQDFMARLRICISADQAPPPDPKDGAPYDIVFSQDVIARHARVEWYPETARPIDLERWLPSRWSRRRPAAKDDMRSVVYLCCPVQSSEGWTYLSATTSFLRGDWDGNDSRRLLPARELDFRDPKTSRIFEETHNLGNWVVNFDELLDRRQLMNQSVRVIRYKQSATQGRNLIISSKASLGLLRSMILRRLTDLNLGIGAGEYAALADRFINDANDISGNIVLRAAKRGRNASELMGVVLSRYLIRHELGSDRYYGTYFLDDYAEWLGQREEQIADILVLSPEQTPEGGLRIAMIVTEAKYIDAASLAAKRKESQKQLRDTIRRVDDAVFGSPGRLDRDLWLARLSDLILDGIQVPASAGLNLADWRRAVRDGECDIHVRGYSHIFVAGPSDASDSSDFARVVELEDSYQEVFGRPKLRDLVLRYGRDEDPGVVRATLSDERVWETRRYRKPTDRDRITVVRTGKKGKDSPPDSGGTESGTGGPAVPPNATGGGVAAVDNRETGPIGKQIDVTGTSATADDSGRSSASSGRWAYPLDRLLPSMQGVGDTDADREWLKQTEAKTKHALQQFQLQAKLLDAKLTPNSALLKFAGTANLTVEQVLRRRSELLTTYGLPVIGVQPEPGAVSISVERPARRVIKIQDLWTQWQPAVGAGNQELLIATRENDGQLLFLSPGKLHAPHTLIAGSTGSGKSVLMQNVILGIAATNTVAQARIVLIDPKQGVDYFQFDGLPHLEGGVIDQQEQAIHRLTRLVSEMDERYSRFKAARVPNLAAYNTKVPEAQRLPTIWLIHDEFAEWMLVDEYKEEVATTVGRLGVKARAAGIYLVFAAQRPDANVMPMQLRANLGNRLILRVDSEGTSEIALGERGAERLLGKGHLLAKLEGETSLIYAQVPFVEGDFMERAVSVMAEAARK